MYWLRMDYSLLGLLYMLIDSPLVGQLFLECLLDSCPFSWEQLTVHLLGHMASEWAQMYRLVTGFSRIIVWQSIESMESTIRIRIRCPKIKVGF